jgi:hypothetical protein
MIVSNIQNFVDYLIEQYNKIYKNEDIQRKDLEMHCNLDVVNYIQTHIAEEKKKEEDILNYYSIDAVGIQSIIPESYYGEGYCVMYSYFWLYLVLHCYKNTRLSYQFHMKLKNFWSKCIMMKN